MKSMKGLALMIMFCPALYANQLSSFSSIVDHLNNGGEILMIAESNRCKVDNPNTQAFMTTTISHKPSAVVFDQNHIAFAGEKYAVGDQYPVLPKGGILQRFSVHMDTSGELNAVLAIFDPETNKRIPGFDDVKVKCLLGEGLRFYSK